MKSGDFDIIELLNKRLSKYNLDTISIDEYFFASELSSNKSPIKIIENLILSRCQLKINKGNIKDLPSDLFSYSITLMDQYKDSAIKIRRYANQFRLINILVTSNINWTVTYAEDKDCKECAYLSNIEIDIENEVKHASCPVESCSLPHGICRNIPIYNHARDREGRVIKHNKDYNQLLKLKFNYDED